MKTILIFLLTMALFGAAFFTRPSVEDCKAFLDRQRAQQSFGQRVKDLFHSHQYTVKDNYLWMDIQRDGKTVYTGAFSHFFKHGDEATK